MKENDVRTWVKDKRNQDSVVARFFDDYPPHKKKLAFFMAGIPGAGKTEFAENTINKNQPKLIPIEHDKLVTYIAGYKPENYYKFRKAGSVLVTRILDECLKNGYAFIFDGTLSHENGHRNIKKALKKGYFVQVVYIVQNAKKAWELTQDRELVYKRAIKKDGFISTCNKINKNLLQLFGKFKSYDNFGFWIINKNGQPGIGSATTILYSKEIGSELDVEKLLSETYTIDELG